MTKSLLFLLCILNLLGRAAQATELGIDSSHFTINGRRQFLLGISYYGALGARDEFIAKDLDDMQRDGFNWIRVWATWSAFTNNVSAVEANGGPREPFLMKLETLVRDCDRRGMIVDVTLSRENGISAGPRLQQYEEHERAVRTLVERLRPLRNWYLDLGNERNIGDARHVPFEDLRKLRQVVRELDPQRLVTASHSSDDEDFAKNIEKYVREVKVDFLSQHRRRGQGSAAETASATKLYLDRLKSLGVTIPIHYDEPFRRGYTRGWEPSADDFVTDLRNAVQAGAAGWCFHNGAQVGPRDGIPRRSFDLREKRLYDQLDPIEREVVTKVGRASK
ncbi:MAG TPA: hypothetical protein VM680_08835 [Verrucomicrobiae bacterium]|nr:hypothetical protein [Verrucomicrobiae bacterium]